MRSGGWVEAFVMADSLLGGSAGVCGVRGDPREAGGKGREVVGGERGGRG